VRPESDSPSLVSLCCVELAGGSPVSVSAGAPRSRLRASGEISPSKRSDESRPGTVRFLGWKQRRGPNATSVNPAASREKHPKGEVAEPIMSRRRQQTAPGRTGWVQDASGVWGRARGESSTRNRRDPTWRPTSGEGGAYKPMAKGNRAGRESEGFVVAWTTATKTPSERRGPALVALVAGGKCEGMSARTNNLSEKARKPWGELFVTAKFLPDRRAFAPSLSVGRDDPHVGGRKTDLGRSASGMRRPSVSRMRETRTYGLNGGHRKLVRLGEESA
jgi:hypothetical protein